MINSSESIMRLKHIGNSKRNFSFRHHNRTILTSSTGFLLQRHQDDLTSWKWIPIQIGLPRKPEFLLSYFYILWKNYLKFYFGFISAYARFYCHLRLIVHHQSVNSMNLENDMNYLNWIMAAISTNFIWGGFDIVVH